MVTSDQTTPTDTIPYNTPSKYLCSIYYISILITHVELSVVQSQQWYNDTDTHLVKLSSRMGGLVTHESWRVRRALCVWACVILNKCSRYVGVVCGCGYIPSIT